MHIAIALYPGFTVLDAIGPYQVLVETPGTEVTLCAAQPGPLADEHNVVTFQIDTTFADIPTPDVIVIPGGPGSKVQAAADSPIVDWIRTAHASTQYTTSVCTGALLLGAAGVLKGKRATTHWCHYDNLATYGAEPTGQRVVMEDDGIITAAGVSAGIDMALSLVAQFAGPEVAQAVQLGIEYDPEPPFDSGAPGKAEPEIADLVRSMILSH